MQTIREAASAFLATKRVAVTGVSRNRTSGHGSNAVYRRLRDRGHEVFAQGVRDALDDLASRADRDPRHGLVPEARPRKGATHVPSSLV